MYESFFGFDGRPFSATPDADCCAGVETMQNAYDELLRGLEDAQGIGVLSAPAGTGKTLLCRKLAADLADSFTTVLLPTCRFNSARSLLQAVLFELNRPYQGMDEQELRLALTDAIREVCSRHEALVLIVDEAHLLSEELLEEIRSITTHVDGGRSLARVLLSGQLSLEDKLTSPKLDALNQRISAQVTLDHLSRAESTDYVDYRLNCVGGRLDAAFTPEAVQAIAEACDGVPRCLNQLCDHALFLGFEERQHPVGINFIHDALNDLKQLPLHWNIPASADEPIEDCEQRPTTEDATAPSSNGAVHAADATDFVEVGEASGVFETAPTINTSSGRQHSPAQDGIDESHADTVGDSGFEWDAPSDQTGCIEVGGSAFDSNPLVSGNSLDRGDSDTRRSEQTGREQVSAAPHQESEPSSTGPAQVADRTQIVRESQHLPQPLGISTRLGGSDDGIDVDGEALSGAQLAGWDQTLESAQHNDVRNEARRRSALSETAASGRWPQTPEIAPTRRPAETDRYPDVPWVAVDLSETPDDPKSLPRMSSENSGHEELPVLRRPLVVVDSEAIAHGRRQPHEEDVVDRCAELDAETGGPTARTAESIVNAFKTVPATGDSKSRSIHRALDGLPAGVAGQPIHAADLEEVTLPVCLDEDVDAILPLIDDALDPPRPSDALAEPARKLPEEIEKHIGSLVLDVCLDTHSAIEQRLKMAQNQPSTKETAQPAHDGQEQLDDILNNSTDETLNEESSDEYDIIQPDPSAACDGSEQRDMPTSSRAPSTTDERHTQKPARSTGRFDRMFTDLRRNRQD